MLSDRLAVAAALLLASHTGSGFQGTSFSTVSPTRGELFASRGDYLPDASTPPAERPATPEPRSESRPSSQPGAVADELNSTWNTRSSIAKNIGSTSSTVVSSSSSSSSRSTTTSSAVANNGADAATTSFLADALKVTESQATAIAERIASSRRSSTGVGNSDTAVADAPLSQEVVEEALGTLTGAGFQASDLSKMLLKCPQLSDPRMADGASAMVDFLSVSYAMRRYDIRRLGRSEPRLFATNTTSVVATAQALGAVGLTGKALVLAIIRWPSLLLVPPPAVASVVSFLTAPLVGFSEAEVGSVLRSAPWLLGDAEAMLRPAAEHLVDRGLKPNLVVRAFPQVLELDVATELAPRLDFLVDEVGLDPVADLPSTVHAFPLLLGLDVDSRMRPVLEFLLKDLGFSVEEAAKICRAFPSLLGLSKAENFEPALAFLSEIGVQNQARFVQRLPPVLGYDVDTNLKPKWDFLVNTLRLTTFDVSRFPAYFSYPLEKVTMPRMAYLAAVNQPNAVWGLNLILTPSDDIFATKVAGTSKEAYATFKAAFTAQRQRSNGLKNEAEEERAKGPVPRIRGITDGLGIGTERAPGEAW